MIGPLVGMGSGRYGVRTGHPGCSSLWPRDWRSWVAVDRRRIREAKREWPIGPPSAVTGYQGRLPQGGEVVHRLTHVGPKDSGDQPPDRAAEQPAVQISGEMKVRSGTSGIPTGDRHRDRNPNPTSPAALQLNRFRLVIAGDFPVDDVAEALDPDARRDTSAHLDRCWNRAAPAAENRHPFIESPQV